MSKIVLITGASRGIGAATALLAAKNGYNVVVNYRSNQQAAENVLSQIAAIGVRAKAFQADASNETDVLAMFDFIDQEFGGLDALVNNAGILEKQMRVVDMSVDRFSRILHTNVISYFLCSREAIKRMSTKTGGKGGSIVNISSKAATMGSPHEYVDYASSKGAIDTFTIGLAKEVAAEGIRVNGIRPGVIYTDIHASGGEANRVDRVKSSVPMQRGGQADEVAEAILWFMTEKSSYCTGTIIDVSGGR